MLAASKSGQWARDGTGVCHQCEHVSPHTHSTHSVSPVRARVPSHTHHTRSHTHTTHAHTHTTHAHTHPTHTHTPHMLTHTHHTCSHTHTTHAHTHTPHMLTH